MRRRHLPVLLLAVLAGGMARSQPDDPWPALAQPGTILLVRHALAPGVGDPPGLRLDDIVCDPSFVAGDRHLERYAAALGARLVVAPLRASDGTPRHDVNRLASVYADLIGH